MTIGEMIRSARKKAGLTQAELGAKLDVSGSMIGQWENNLRKPKPKTMWRITEALGQPFTELLKSTNIPLSQLMGYSPVVDTPESRTIADAGIKSLLENMDAFQNGTHEATTAEIDKMFAESGDAKLLAAYRKLNADGQQVAIERVQELTQIPKYQSPVSSEGFENDEGDADTTERKKPSEDHQSSDSK